MNGYDRIRAAYDAPGLDEHERAVLVLLAFMANEDAQAWPSIAYLVEKTGKGERTIQRAIQRLKEAGHIHRKQLRHGVIYTVLPGASDGPNLGHADPLTPVPQTGVAETGVSPTGVPQGVETRTTDTQTTKRTTNSQKTTSSSKRAREQISFSLPDWVPADPWNRYAEMRRAKRKPLTDNSARLAIEQLERLASDGHPPGEVLDQSTLNDWTGLFELKASTVRQEPIFAARANLGRTAAAAESVFGRSGRFAQDDCAASVERHAEFLERMGRQEDAAERRAEAARLRSRAQTGVVGDLR